MKALYQKSEMTFAIVMIVLYVGGTLVAQQLTDQIGITALIPAIFHIALVAVLAYWIISNGLAKKYGLIKPPYPADRAWFFLPILIVATSGLITGFDFRYTAVETILFIVSMTCIGFLEEVIFRGFLFLAMAKSNLMAAIIVSSLTFGLGHIVNLLNGAPLMNTLMQIVFAIVVGFTLVLLFYNGKSLVPCIVFHSLNNSLAIIEKTSADAASSLSMSETAFNAALLSFCVVLLVVYCTFCLKNLRVREDQQLHERQDLAH
ncbi:MAG: CPBP family intramembrane glutamic endopeptidase [Actinomyces sp.]|nr:CPBP family intramembrane glutamic endopeptidase [Actinomyces sp.]